jgi:hypothetical protein
VIALAVVDVDGCLTPGVGSAWNWEALRTVSEFNQRARCDEQIPAVTLCTGRQQPYVEALMQAIGAFLPGIYEHGCGLYFPESFQFAEHPSITAETREAVALAKAAITEQIVARGLGYFQPGKEVSLSVLPSPGRGVDGLRPLVEDALAARALDLKVQASVDCVDVTPPGIDKGAGLRWLSEVVDVPLERMGGIGDSSSDLSFLRLVGQSAAPANAVAEVKASVAYVSPLTNGDGVVDILGRWMGGF